MRRQWTCAFPVRFAVAVLALALSAVLSPASVRADPEDDAADALAGDILLDEINDRFVGDWTDIVARRTLRVLTTYSRTNFLIENGNGRGLEFEAMSRFEAWVNATRKRGTNDIRVVFVPVAWNDLIPALLEGRGDVIAAGMTRTPERARRVAFSEPYIRGVSEVVVRARAAPAVAKPEDLAGKTLMLTRGASYVESVRALDARLRATGKSALRIVEAPENLETEDILEMVNAGIVDYTVADAHLADAWAGVLKNVAVEKRAAVAERRDIAWAVRPGAAELRKMLDRFVAERVRKEKTTVAVIFKRYFESARFLENPLDPESSDRIRRHGPAFRRESERVGFNWLMMLAQGYQESHLDHLARSPVGAVGLMQLMPATGEQYGARDLTDAEENVRAGITYMNALREKYFNDPAIPDADRVYFALAAYNAGPNRINRLRQEAAKRGLDPNRWFGNVERIVQRRVGSEPVRYVANIRAYFITYANVIEQLDLRSADIEAVREALGKPAK
jgi:membrane-bound lytic murein transglycosylase MltF